MRAGKLRHLVTIESCTLTTGSDGTTDKTWNTFTTRWARIRTPSGREVERAAALGGALTRVVVWRHEENYPVTHDMRIVHGIHTLQILAVRPDETEMDFEVVDCGEKAKNA